ncbi:hypothetical protein ATANTOWER_002679 [Ataeniobius toweri]|uniref:Uncharacterized protein n=1 Tax=Ataeniobius toweri TaxID=208326 RepID=A0ABU7ACX8_9TELE|nr:hypothetical protein [Ataeniobius toweri]
MPIVQLPSPTLKLHKAAAGSCRSKYSLKDFYITRSGNSFDTSRTKNTHPAVNPKPPSPHISPVSAQCPDSPLYPNFTFPPHNSHYQPPPIHHLSCPNIKDD